MLCNSKCARRLRKERSGVKGDSGEEMLPLRGRRRLPLNKVHP
jgi:hypothetical protein